MLSKEEIERLKGQHPGEVVNVVLNHICENDPEGYEVLRKILNKHGSGFTKAIESAVGGRLLPETAGGGPVDDAFLGFCWDSRGAAGA